MPHSWHEYLPSAVDYKLLLLPLLRKQLLGWELPAPELLCYPLYHKNNNGLNLHAFLCLIQFQIQVLLKPV